MNELTIVIKKIIDPVEEVEGLKVPFYAVYRDWGSGPPCLSYWCQSEQQAWEYLSYICKIRAESAPIL